MPSAILPSLSANLSLCLCVFVCVTHACACVHPCVCDVSLPPSLPDVPRPCTLVSLNLPRPRPAPLLGPVLIFSRESNVAANVLHNAPLHSLPSAPLSLSPTVPPHSSLSHTINNFQNRCGDLSTVKRSTHFPLLLPPPPHLPMQYHRPHHLIFCFVACRCSAETEEKRDNGPCVCTLDHITSSYHIISS